MMTQHYRIWAPEEYSYPDAYGFIPKLTTYLHEDGIKRPGMLVIPGGAYALVSPTEAENVALRFYEFGYQAFVLTYTTNVLSRTPLKLQPLKDISRAMRMIRKECDAYTVDPDRLAICGFSAGGHLCASLCVHFMDIADENPAFSSFSNRPDAAILSYPVISSGPFAHQGSILNLLGADATQEELEYMSLETQVSAQTPPCFVWATETDGAVPVENSELFVKALRQNKIPCAFHMFSHGGHGLSLADESWVNGVNMKNYTVEQILCILEKEDPAVLETCDAEWALQFGRNWSDYSAIALGIGEANPEAAAWPLLADGFLKTVLS